MMRKSLIVFAASAALLAGCGRFNEQEAIEKAAAEVKQATAEAEARAAAGPTEEEKKQAVVSLITAVCASPGLIEEVEGGMDLFQALSGEGADKNEARNHFLRSQRRYRAMLEERMPGLGSTYEALAGYAVYIPPNQTAPERMKELRVMIKNNCSDRDPAVVEKVVGGLLFYCVAPVPR